MKKIPRLLIKDDDTDELILDPRFADIIQDSVATVKWEGSATAVLGGKFYVRYDLKRGQTIPEGCIPCQDKPYEGTAHFPVWRPADNLYDKSVKWYQVAYLSTSPKLIKELGDWTYEAVGPHFQDNPYGLQNDVLVPHGKKVVYPTPVTVEEIKQWMVDNYQEGLVYWYNGAPLAKIRRKDFGLPWCVRGQTAEL